MFASTLKPCVTQLSVIVVSALVLGFLWILSCHCSARKSFQNAEIPLHKVRGKKKNWGLATQRREGRRKSADEEETKQSHLNPNHTEIWSPASDPCVKQDVFWKPELCLSMVKLLTWIILVWVLGYLEQREYLLPLFHLVAFGFFVLKF